MNEQDFNRVGRVSSRGGVRVRPVPETDGRAQDAAPADSPHSAASHPYFARMQRVRAAERTGKDRSAKPCIITRRLSTGAQYYAYSVVDGKRVCLGKFATRGLASAVIKQAEEAMDEQRIPTMHEIVDEFVDEVVKLVPDAQRRAWFNHPNDPIAPSACRLKLAFTLEQVGRLYGISRERVRQVQEESIGKIKRGGSLASFEHSTLGRVTMWDELANEGES